MAERNEWIRWFLAACLWLPACGEGSTATIAIQVRAAPDSAGPTRRFPPNTPLPDSIGVLVLRSDDLLNGVPVADLRETWEGLDEDPATGNKYLLVTVPPNEGQSHDYVLRLSSVVEGEVDECGVIGRIRAAKGAKVRLDLVTHLGDCSQVICQSDEDCIGSRYCLSFECQESAGCGACPLGAYCDSGTNLCSGACGEGDDPCDQESGFTCCGGTCSWHCPG